MKDKKILLFWWLTLLTSIVFVTSCSKDSYQSSFSEVITNDGEDCTEQADSSRKDGNQVIYMLPETQNILLTDEQRQMVKRSNKFSYDVYNAVYRAEPQKGKSLLMSPLSLMYVLGMLNDGAGGDTEKELSSLFGLPTGSKSTINSYCQALLIQAPQADPSVMLQTANIVAVANDMKTAQQYKEDMQKYYAAEIASLDFTQPSALQFLNSWCNQNTQGMIPSILETLSPATRMVLMNAVYFRATWTEKFDPADTRDEKFIVEDAHVSTVPMMHRKAIALYAQNDTYSMLCLPYGSGTQWQMMVMLPNDDSTVDDVIENLSSSSWEELWQKNRSRCEVDIKMPRFSTASDIRLNDAVAQKGAPLIFNSQADFSLMTDSKERLSVSLIKQKAAIEVSEEGTEASAVTVTDMLGANMSSLKEVTFHANRPFVYIIREASSGAVFFIGTYRGV